MYLNNANQKILTTLIKNEQATVVLWSVHFLPRTVDVDNEYIDAFELWTLTTCEDVRIYY
jgi:hypothetical protein